MASETLTNIIVKLGASSKELFAELANADAAIAAFVSKSNSILAGLDLGVGLMKHVKSFADFGNELAMFSATTGIAVEDVSRLGGALEYFGGNADAAKSTLESLQNAALKASEGTGPLLDISQKYGLELKDSNNNIKDTISLYEDLADVFAGLSSAQKLEVASNLGLDSSSIQLLQLGKVAVQDYMQEQTKLAGITAQQASDSREWILTITHLKQTFNSLGGEIASQLIPTLNSITMFMANLANKLRDNKKLINDVAEVIKNNLVPAFAFAAAGIGMAMLPLMRSLLPLTIIALLINDISKFMQGGKSVLGDLFGDKGDAVREKIQNIFSGLSGIVSAILTGDFDKALKQFTIMWNKDILPLANDFGQLMLNSILEYLPLVITEIFELLPSISEFIMELFYNTLFAIVGGLAESINNIVMKLGFGPIFKDKEGKAVNGSQLGKDLVEGFNFISDKVDKSLFGVKDTTSSEERKLAILAAIYGVNFKTRREDIDRAKGRLPLNTSTVSPSATSDNRNFNIFNNYNTTINSNTPVNASVVKRGVESGVKQGNSGFNLFNGLAITGG